MYFWLWLIVMLLSIIVEIMTATSLICIWFAPGALASMVANHYNLSFIKQIIIFFAVSMLAFAIIRPIAKKYLRGNIIATNADRIIGQNVRLLKTITFDQLGEIKVFGNIWNAISIDNTTIKKDTLVKIVAIEGSKVIVKKI